MEEAPFSSTTEIDPALRERFVDHVKSRKDIYVEALHGFRKIVQQRHRLIGYGVSTARSGDAEITLEELYGEGVWQPRMAKYGARVADAHRLYKEAMEQGAKMLGLDLVAPVCDANEQSPTELDAEEWVDQFCANDIRTAAWRDKGQNDLEGSMIDEAQSLPTDEELDFLHDPAESLTPSDGYTGICQRETCEENAAAQPADKRQASLFAKALQKLNDEAHNDRLDRYLSKVGDGAPLPHGIVYVGSEEQRLPRTYLPEWIVRM
jgi:hypothetical protein